LTVALDDSHPEVGRCPRADDPVDLGDGQQRSTV
jgi:hypothetical protein